MRIIVVLLAILILLTSCAKEEQIQPPVTPPVTPPVQPPVQPEQPPVQPPVTPPVTPPVIPEPNITPQPPAVVSNLPVCDIIGRIGHVYSEADIGGTYIPGQQITNEQSEDLSVCYPYFLKTVATTQSVCCVI